ncbi:hypothetical protein [Acinetobacter silvestris]|uniref:Uncharacterized protein n=1 Tax=Acinetobacter silvestris TaxID=1977882 RepID=A0A1Y3CFU5_9GAMM|nr:hypothetical protein [Acinetobacter silvestris]OTG65980.1 hypothetical protein B9T28_07220 [Acinetobacter silvestris]
MRIKTKKYKHVVFTALVLSGVVWGIVPSFAVASLDDASLAQESIHLETLTPTVITALKESVDLSAESQQILYDKIAQQRTDDQQENMIDSSVLTDYQLQKIEENITTGLDEKQAFIPAKYRTVEYGVSAKNNMVRVTTEDKITIYVSRDTH